MSKTIPSPSRTGRLLAILLGSPVFISCGMALPGGTPPAKPQTPTPTLTAATSLGDVIPLPLEVNPAAGAFNLTADAAIFVEPATPELTAVGEYLAAKLRSATGYALPVREAHGAPAAGNIYLTTVGGDPALGGEGYALAVTPDFVAVVAPSPAGVFYGAQTVRQLFPPAVEKPSIQPGPWTLPAGTIRDKPRFAWRGAMLDVGRHFFGVDDVKQYIDRLAYYKLNRFHLHLTDDQGWRIEIKKWPDLAAVGGSTAVGGDPGGFYTQAQYAEIVRYAAERFITVVPEIDMPGHTNAALASYAELNCDRVARPLHTGIEVGFSSLCVQKDITYAFIDDVIGELAAITPGPWIHIGGDEVQTLSAEEYRSFVQKVQAIVTAHGKQMIGWNEIAPIDFAQGTLVQHWTGDSAVEAARKGSRVIISPPDRIYLDMKYNEATTLGLHWAGYVDVQASYSWDPSAILPGVPEEMILGVEAPLWTETIRTRADLEYMVFPRLLSCAEIGWSAQSARHWPEYRLRLGLQAPRFAAWNLNYYADKSVVWK
jgi:hexosaminidase